MTDVPGGLIGEGINFTALALVSWVVFYVFKYLMPMMVERFTETMSEMQNQYRIERDQFRSDMMTERSAFLKHSQQATEAIRDMQGEIRGLRRDLGVPAPTEVDRSKQ